MTSVWLFIFENEIIIPSKSNKQKKWFFVDVLKVTDENSRIRIRISIRIYYSEVWIRGSGFAPKFHGSATLMISLSYLAHSCDFFKMSSPYGEMFYLRVWLSHSKIVKKKLIGKKFGKNNNAFWNDWFYNKQYFFKSTALDNRFIQSLMLVRFNIKYKK